MTGCPVVVLGVPNPGITPALGTSETTGTPKKVPIVSAHIDSGDVAYDASDMSPIGELADVVALVSETREVSVNARKRVLFFERLIPVPLELREYSVVVSMLTLAMLLVGNSRLVPFFVTMFVSRISDGAFLRRVMCRFFAVSITIAAAIIRPIDRAISMIPKLPTNKRAAPIATPMIRSVAAMNIAPSPLSVMSSSVSFWCCIFMLSLLHIYRYVGSAAPRA